MKKMLSDVVVFLSVALLGCASAAIVLALLAAVIRMTRLLYLWIW